MKIRRLLCLVLAMLFCICSFASCNTGSGTNESETTTGGETTVEQETTEPIEETTENPDDLLISSDLLSNYVIIYSENATDNEKKQAIVLQMAIETAFGVSLEFRDDFVREGTSFTESEYEILIGRCNRSASRDFCADFRSDDYGYGIVGTKLVIAGMTEEGTIAAVTAFLRDGIGAAGGDFFQNKDRVVVRGTYDVSEVLLNGTSLAAYTVVYPKGDSSLKSAAEYLVARIQEEYCYILPTTNDEASVAPYEILLGNTNRDTSQLKDDSLGENDYMLAAADGMVWLAGVTSTMVYRAVDGLVKGFSADGEVIRMDLSVPVKVTCETSNLRSMTFNIRCAEYTNERIELVFRMIDIYAPDTIGFQEATVKWMNLLKDRLGDRYGYVGVGRNADHSGEASPVFYLKSKFELLDGGTKWMTSTPDVAGSKIPESSLPRVFSWAVLKVKATGQTFVHVNTHLEHTSEEARVIQAQYLVEFLESFRSSGVSYIVSGDFNCERGAGSYATVASAGLRDAISIATKKETGATYHGYGEKSKVIDHIFVSGGVDVSFYRACSETFRNADGSVGYPSDHNPVIIDYVIR